MRVGILSDTHGRANAARRAVELLQQRGAEFLLHCGDVGDETVLDVLAGNHPPAAFVFGNNDVERAELAKYAETIGVKCLHEFGELTLDGKRFAITHGDDLSIVHRVLREQSADYLLLGHTHIVADDRDRRVRVINPGALFRARQKTVALLETAADTLEILNVDW